MDQKKLLKRGLVIFLFFSFYFSVFAQPDSDKPRDLKAVFNENLYVIGEECVGGDCVNGEALALTTLKLKENNLRIDFDDTSNTLAFANNDWRIQVNDSFNGGADYFRIDDATGGTSPFHIEAGADTNALYIDDAGNIGFGTNAPSMTLHVVGDGLITGEFEVLSDIKVKKNITNIINATDKLIALRAVTYDMRSSEFPLLKLSEDKQYGLIAQEVKEVLPELVSIQVNKANEESMMSVNYIQLIPLLIKANQEQGQIISDQANEIGHLENAISLLTKRIEKLENR